MRAGAHGRGGRGSTSRSETDWRAQVVAHGRSAPDLKAHEVNASLGGAATPGAGGLMRRVFDRPFGFIALDRPSGLVLVAGWVGVVARDLLDDEPRRDVSGAQLASAPPRPAARQSDDALPEDVTCCRVLGA